MAFLFCFYTSVYFLIYFSYCILSSKYTVIKGKSSVKSTIKTEVPQGSIIGPLLFILFINDLPLALDKSDTNMYLDNSSSN